MENRRGGGQRGDNYFSPEVSRRRSFSQKPPKGSWQPAVPSWEKTFCKVVGSLDWDTIVYMKKFVHLYDNVVKWDDSAGEEAFHNAKKRFLAKMHDIPCDVTLPDPDLYIDEVDWDSNVDSELLSELEYRSVVPDVAENNGPVVIFGDSLLRNQGFSAAGWGECEEDLKKPTNSFSNNHDNPWEQSPCKSKETARDNGWEGSANNACVPDVGSGVMGDTGWGVGWDNSWSWNHHDGQKAELKNLKVPENGGASGYWDVSYGKKNNAGRFMSRYKTSRFHANEQQGGCAWRNGNGRKRGTYFHKSSTADSWNLMNSCGPLSYHASGTVGQTWNLEKPVS